MIDRKSYEPLYVQVRKDIEDKILEGHIKIGDKLMSEAEMIRYYNVGRMTIRAALSELVSSGCVKKEQGLGTFCVALPKREISKKIDVLLNMLDTYFVPYFLTGISRVLDDRNCDMVCHDTMDSQANIVRLLNLIMARGTDGILLQSYTGTDEVTEEYAAAIKLCQAMKIPLVTIGGKVKGIDTPCVMHDNNRGAYVATQHALEMGHKKILGLFQGRYKDAKFRAEGYVQAMTEAGLNPCVLDAAKTDFDDLVKQISAGDVTAIVCYNDYLAVKLYRKFEKVGIEVGEDVSIIGYDDTELSTCSIPALTSITHPKDVMGERATQMLMTLVDGKALLQERHMFEPELVKRNSVKKVN